jgi:hypothetical protein
VQVDCPRLSTEEIYQWHKSQYKSDGIGLFLSLSPFQESLFLKSVHLCFHWRVKCTSTVKTIAALCTACLSYQFLPHLRAVLKAELLFHVSTLANLRIHFIITLNFFPCKWVLALTVLGTSSGMVGWGMRCKLRGCGLDSRLCHWNFSLA